MNYIKRLQADIARLTAERDMLLAGIEDIRQYLHHSKFACGDRLDGYVNVMDVLLRLREAKQASLMAGDDAEASLVIGSVKVQ